MTLFQKDFNVDKMLAELKTPYDDIPKHKLRKLLIERDEEITTHIAEIRTLEKSDRLLEMAKRKLKKLNTENKELKQQLRSQEEETCVCHCPWVEKVDKLEEENKELKEQIEINSKLYKSLEKSNEMKVKTLQTEIKCMELRHDYTMEYIQEWDSIHDWREELEEKAHKRGTWDEIMLFFDD